LNVHNLYHFEAEVMLRKDKKLEYCSSLKNHGHHHSISLAY